MAGDITSPYPPLGEKVAVHEERLNRVEHEIEILISKMDRLIWALTLAALSFTGTAVILIINLASNKNG